MKTSSMPTEFCAALALLAAVMSSPADPLLSSWFTANSTKYARIYTSTANRTADISTTTWTGQTLPTYAGVHEINYSANWVYLKNTGLGGHVMGPWNNPNLPKNQATGTPVYRFPRTVTIPGTKTLTSLGALGFLVDGVAIYDTRDAFSYKTLLLTDASPQNGLTGDGIWNRDAWANEAASFDAAFAHQPPSGQYHCHASPLAVRYLLGDNVNFDSSTKLYSENTATTTFKHSPLLGWLSDGIPLYGPYAYDGGSTGATGVASVSGASVTGVTLTASGSLYQSTPVVTFTGGGGSGAAATAVVTGGSVSAITMVSGGSGYTDPPTVVIGGVRRMISGYVKRDGSNGTTNLGSTGRHTLPAWAALAQNRSATLGSTQYGPAVSIYSLGHYIEDYDYLGDLGYTQGSRTNAGGVFFDLNQYNVRFCVTPEFPNGTWAYFVTIQADGTPWYPYNVGRWFYGSTTGAGTTNTTVMNADTPLTQYFKGGPSTVETWPASPVAVANGNVTIAWSAVEGGTYQVQASNDLATWATVNPAVTATGNTASLTESGVANSNLSRFYKFTRTGLATYDSNGF